MNGPFASRWATIFFATETPRGQQALHDGVELTDHVWLRPEQALADFRAGRRQMIIPTWANLETLLGFDSAAAAVTPVKHTLVIEAVK